MNAWLTPDWPAPPGVRAITTTRHGLGVSQPPFDAFNLGSRCGDEADAVAENRRQLAAALGLPSPPRWLRQVHGTGVVRLDGPHSSPPPQAGEGAQARQGPHPSQAREAFAPPPASAGGGWEGGAPAEEPEADAAVTATPGTVLAILTADCLPVVFAAKDGREIAAAHAGWRGLAAGVLEATVAAMSTDPGDVIAWLGPAAGPDAYEIDAPVRDAFLAHDPRAASAFVATRPGHWRIDLYAIARQRLQDAGIAVADIHGGGLCTISEPTRFFSHRRDGRGGRIATLVWRQA